ncbi:MAG: hypothetical protein JW759_10530 [Candidatus Coatesbacteria bacterium]|nr:hypothetical protein [Candidatus Coatesbacteria bacterium]
MASVVERTRLAVDRNDSASAVGEIESYASSDARDVALLCRAILIVLLKCTDASLCQRLSRVLTALEPQPGEAYLANLVASLCNCRIDGRVDVDVLRFKEFVAASSRRRPAILAVWDAMELFNQGKGRDAIEALWEVYNSSGNLLARDLLMKSYLRTAYNHVAKEQYEEAADVLKESLKADSYNVLALHALAILETQKTSLSSLDEIEKCWRRLVEIWTALDRAYPEQVFSRKLIAKYEYFAARFLKAGSWEKAKQELVGLTRVEPSNALAKEVLAAIS